MHVVGILNDQSMAFNILKEYEEREIKGHYYFEQASNAYVIAIEDEEYLPIALDIYRVKLGLKKPVELDQEWVKIKTIPRGKFTTKLIIFCVIIYLFSYLPIGKGLYDLLMINGQQSGFLNDFFKGQIWRIVTPIFLHMGFFHILFNMLWINDLGRVFEYKFSIKKFVIFILISGIFSNLLQYFFKGPSFGGMSGVLYALLSFLWINKKLNPDFEFSLPKHDTVMMILWFFLCLFGIFPNVANFAHAGGIFVGILGAIALNYKISFDRFKYFGYALFVLVVTVIVEKFNLHF